MFSLLSVLFARLMTLFSFLCALITGAVVHPQRAEISMSSAHKRLTHVCAAAGELSERAREAARERRCTGVRAAKPLG